MKEKLNDDLDKYISRRKRKDKAFAKEFDAGYEKFIAGALLKQAKLKKLKGKLKWEGSLDG